MSTLRNNGILVWVFADDTGERYTLQLRIFISRVLFLRISVTARDLGSSCDLLALGDILPLLVQLPALLVILSRMEVLAVVSKSTESGLLVLLRELV